MVAKYNMLEKDIYKKMFSKNEPKKLQIEAKKPEIDIKPMSSSELIMTEKVSLEKNREFIIKKIK